VLAGLLNAVVMAAIAVIAIPVAPRVHMSWQQLFAGLAGLQLAVVSAVSPKRFFLYSGLVTKEGGTALGRAIGIVLGCALAFVAFLPE
jgi:hypothetical protein